MDHQTDLPRLRSKIACQACNRRKVRCDVTRTGIPCSNCKDDAGKCEVLPRKKHRPRRPREATGTASSQPHTAVKNQVPFTQDECTPATDRHTGGPFTATPDDDVDVVLPDDSSLSYIGDRRGPRSAVYDICHPSEAQDPRPYVPPVSTSKPRKAYEIECMRDKGVFDTLPNDVADEIMRCYFQHVHFFMPVVDAASFLVEYTKGANNISPLLHWSMVLAAANFVSTDLYHRAGYSSRRAMKVAMYNRAKCLYDLDQGTDKLVLIQAVVLMGFWYTDPQDHTGAWHWTGIAISFCQNLGLHRNPQPTSGRSGVSELFMRHARRLWWSCFIRDRWISLAKGRPMRIHLEDCDVPMPAADDILLDFTLIAAEIQAKFLPAETSTLATMWIQFVQISDALGRVLKAHYCVNGPRPNMELINRLADQLQSCAQPGSLSDTSSDALSLQTCQLGLSYQAAVTVLYRPFVLGGSAALGIDAPDFWHKQALDKARAAASRTNSLLERLIELNGIQLLRPMMISTLIPSMQIHLYDYKSSDPLVSGLAANRLQLCMLVLSKLRETYWSAGVMYRLFERAQRILKDSKQRGKIGDIVAPRTSDHVFPEVNDLQAELQPALPPNTRSSALQPEPDPWSSLSGAEAAASWDDLSFFSAVDELLDPSFGFREDAFHGLYPSGHDGTYQMLSSAGQSNGTSTMGLLYTAS